MPKPAPRGAVRDLTEALRLINGVRTGYDLTADEQRRLLDLAVKLRDATQGITARGILTDGFDTVQEA